MMELPTKGGVMIIVFGLPLLPAGDHVTTLCRRRLIPVGTTHACRLCRRLARVLDVAVRLNTEGVAFLPQVDHSVDPTGAMYSFFHASPSRHCQ